MGAPLALVICFIGIAGLFYLDRDKTVRTSIALWLPVMWIWIVGSRPVSAWLGIGASSGNFGRLDATLDGSPTDAFVFAVLLAAGILVLLQRRSLTSALLRLSGPILVYYFYCLASVSWSPVPDPAFKRWTKYVGDLVMVLIIVTDPQPAAALRRVFSRVGFILLPLSIVLTRYTDMGRGYDPSGGPTNTGVTTNKNSLGLIACVISLGALWSLRTLLADKGAPNRGRRIVAQATLLGFGVVVMQMAHSATAGACFILGAGVLLATSLPSFSKRPARVHALLLTIVLVGGLTVLFGGESIVTNALGRNADLTGRTEIWAAEIPVCPNRLIGAGFESFWNGYAGQVAKNLPGYWDITNLNSAHNGYIQIYLDLGWVGVALIGIILISGYRRAFRAFQRNPQIGSLSLAYVAAMSIYSITEVGFRVLTASWIFFLLAVVSAEGVTAGIFGGVAPERSVPGAELAGATLAGRKLAFSQRERADSRHPTRTRIAPIWNQYRKE
jgi:exopolysaccharide production protein ExoQ